MDMKELVRDIQAGSLWRGLYLLILTALMIMIPLNIYAEGAPYADSGQSLGSSDSYCGALGDVDGDGDIDVFVANLGASGVGQANKVWLNDGTGSYVDSGQNLGSSESTYALLGDVDNDGDLDAYVVNRNSQANRVYSNDGLGMFVDSGQSLGSSSGYGGAMGDLDGDGDLDVFTANYGHSNKVWLNDGTGVYVDSGQTLGGSAASSGVALGDVDGDGDLDAFVANDVYEADRVWLNDGLGMFVDSGQSLGGSRSLRAALGDMDNDGDLDAYVATYVGLINYLWINQGGVQAGTEGAFVDSGQSLGLSWSTDAVLGDIDIDGDLDVFVANSGTRANTLWLNDGDGILTDSGLTLGAFWSAGIQLGDVDQDGDLDAFVANYQEGNRVWNNNMIHRQAVFGDQYDISSPDPDDGGSNNGESDGAYCIRAADLDGDGDMDVAVSSAWDSKVSWYENRLNEGTNDFGAQQVISTAAHRPFSIHIADLDNDGDDDILSASDGDDEIAWYENRLNEPSADFGSQEIISVLADNANKVFSADLDNDGDQDVLSSSRSDSKIAWYENRLNEAGNDFGAQEVISTSVANPYNVYAADLDNDGDMDVLSASGVDDKIAWYENRLNELSADFGAQQVITTSADWAYGLYTADLDNDGDQDVLSASGSDDKVAWYENRLTEGPADFGTQQVITTEAEGAVDVLACDLDRDGDPDVISASGGDDSIAWYENRLNEGTADFGERRVITTAANGAISIFAADLNNDGNPDILYASANDDNAAVHFHSGGQINVGTTDTAPVSVFDSDVIDVLKITVSHNGITDDEDAEFDYMELLLEKSGDVPLTTTEAEDLFSSVDFYLDDGSGEFESGSDTLFAGLGSILLTGGVLQVDFPTSSPSCLIEDTSTNDYFVVLGLNSDASTYGIDYFRLTHQIAATGMIKYLDYDYYLTLQEVSDTQSGLVKILAPDSTAPDFSDFLRCVPLNGAMYFEWQGASDPSTPLTYEIYLALTSGAQTFGSPDAATSDESLVMGGLVNGTPYYVVVRAKDAFDNITANTNEIICIPGNNMLVGAVYNADFEQTSGSRSVPRSPAPGKPNNWSASSQDYGDKITSYYLDDTNPYEGTYCALVETADPPTFPDPGDLSIASLTSDISFPLLKDHTYAVSAAVRRSHSQWTRFIMFSSGFSLIHTESLDALDDGTGDSGWEIMYFHFRAPSNVNGYVRIDSIVTNSRTEGGQKCRMWVDDVQVDDLGIETFTDIYNVTPPPPQYGIRNRYFDLGTEIEVNTLGGIAYSCGEMSKRWNMAMAVDEGTNHAPGYPLWGEEVPVLTNSSGNAGYVVAKAADTSLPAWPAIACDGVKINDVTDNGQRHVLTFDYGALGVTRPLLRVFMIRPDFSHYSSLFVDPSIGIPGNRMWPVSLHYTPEYGDTLVLIRFDNVTLAAGGGGVHTDETTMYIDNAILGVVSE